MYNWTLGQLGKTNPKRTQTNPKRTQNEPKFKKAKMNVSSIITVGYENKSPIWAPKKQSQTSKRQKTMQTSLPKRIMKETRFWVRTKQTQFKPKQTQFQRFSRLDFDNILDYSKIWKSFRNRILRRTTKCGPRLLPEDNSRKISILLSKKHFHIQGKGLIMKQQTGENGKHLDHGKHCSGHNCSHGAPNIDEKTFFFSRFIFFVG